MKLTKPLLMLVVLIGLVGCVQAPKKQAFNQAMATHIKSVVIARDQDQDRYEAVMLGHPGMGFGLIGGLVAAADMQSKGTRLTEAIKPAETVLQQRFEKVLVDRLQALGYSVSTVMLPKDTKDADVLASVRKQGVKSDAVLAVRLNGAYYAAGPASDYFPRLFATAILYDGSDKELYADTFSYGYTTAQSTSIHFAAGEQYRFANLDALVANPQKTRDGLIAGLDIFATQIAADLKKQ
jgi:hypothetical protein